MDNSLSWEDEAVGVQQKFYNLFGDYDWDSYEYSERQFLEKKVGFALFGPPSELPSSINQTGYNTKQYEEITKVCSAILREDKHGQSGNAETFMSIIFVCLEVPVPRKKSSEEQISGVQPIPIFRVPNDLTGPCFIDYSARVYQTWKDFLNNNELPECRYCYPYDGFYQTDDNGVVLVDFGKTPACNVKRKVLSGLDITNAGVSFGSAVISVASLFFPITGPLMVASLWGGVTAGAYGLVRSSTILVDRANHSQSIGLKDSDARSCWLSFAGSAFGTASMGANTAITMMTEAGQIVSSAGRMTSTILNIGSVTLNGLGVLNGAFMLQNKFKDGELTALDVFQFTASVLFFTHSAVTLKTADSIIKETQTEVIETYKESLEKSKISRVICRIRRGGKDVNTPEGRAEVIRKLKEIENKDDFVWRLVYPNRYFRNTKAHTKFVNSAYPQQLIVYPKNFCRINRNQHQIILKAIQNLTQEYKSWDQLSEAAKVIWKHQNISTTQLELNERMASISDLLQGSGIAGISMVAQRVLQQSVDMWEMLNVYSMSNYDKNLHLPIVEVASLLFEQIALFKINWFLRILDFVCKIVCNIASEIEERYKDDLKAAEEELGADFDQQQFDRHYFIRGKRFDHFCSIVLEKSLDPLAIVSLKNSLFSLTTNCLCTLDHRCI
ncbi:uncharacterized protein [Anabrus simplex]|uniref:uncharacterized protein n=1 Tax=Anabrus simplex TaxID=316456 RepID=UPI0035A26336